MRLISSASGLAMLPFELSLAPGGFPSEGDWLSTQSVAPLLMTREIRGAPGHGRSGPLVPRVLFAWSEPPDQSEVFWQAHLQSLVGALRSAVSGAFSASVDTAIEKRIRDLVPDSHKADFDERLAEARLMSRLRTPAPTTGPLSQRELEVLRLVAAGHTNREAAARLFITEATVKTHLLNIYAKLDVNDRAAAVAEGYNRGLLTPSR